MQYNAMLVRLTCEEDQLLQSFRRIKNGELRGCILKLVSNVNKRVNKSNSRYDFCI